ncbi:hypothetical protein RN001_014280 [Aquatica leii]|uniref:Small ribosomal subunit protein mS23 n=1 Tax=Aquatica leii TaxID=1421715 RepID=A0AAN7SP19_9COLE|nr:hypothetical protein RN001_014280 [Aquatica leii]
MARSRLEKIGTIYSRTKGLLQSGALQWEDRPIWYDLYEAFPPIEEPRYDRPAPNIPIRKIFYEEDKVRALFHNRNKHIGTINMFNNTSTTLTKKFIQAYTTLDEKYKGEVSQEQLYEEAIELVQREKQKFSKAEDEISLVSSFKQAQAKQDSGNIPIKVSDLFKD